MTGADLQDAIACELPGHGRALFTTRAAGNLSWASGQDHARGLARRAALCERLGLRWLCASRQVHGSAVHVVRAGGGRAGRPAPIDADGHATVTPALGAMVLAADCLPVALGCEGAVATVHAGWRGLAAGVLEQGLRTLRELGAQGPVLAVIGPGAGGCCYEVGPEVHAALGRRPPAAGSANIDLKAVAAERLRAAGAAEVRDVGRCTICEESFFSHRREGARAGRQAGIAWLS